jgi:hypothetical protein
MDNQQERDLLADDSPADKNTDVTRSENQQASAAASGRSGDREGSLSEDGAPHQSEGGGQGHTGSHQEGMYNKQDTGKTMGQFMKERGDTTEDK